MKKVTELPRAILDYILEYVEVESVLELSLVSKYFYGLTNDEYIWKRKCFDDFNISQDIAYRQTGWKDLYFSLRNPSVYTWGENFDSRLGLSAVDEVSDMYRTVPSYRRIGREVAEPKEVMALKGKGIIDIVSGGWSFHALDRYGDIWFWGTMQSNMSPRDSIGVERIKTPTRLPSSVKFKSISSGRGHGIGLAQDGSVWHWSNCRVMQRVDIDWTVVQVTANWEYSSVLTDTGSILIVPRPDYIIHSQQDQIPQPTQSHTHVTSRDILGDSNDTIVQLAGLEDHTLALTKFGKVLKLHTVRGIEFASNPSEFVQTLVPFGAPERETNDRKGKMRRFITGQFRSFAVYTADDVVLIGHTGDSADAEPTRFSGLDVCKVSFGDHHRGALTNQGKLMTWGQYSSGALGHGRDDQDLQNPKYVDKLRDKYVISIGFGGWQSSALVIDLRK